jgi:glycosyltransferase involved in cell wall biosynthesis
LARRYAPWLDVVVGVSREIERHLKTMPALAKTRVEYLPYGIDFSDAPGRSFDPASPLRIIYVGRLIEEQKRVSRFIELARLLCKQSIPFQFTIAGAGPEEGRLRSELGAMPSVRFTGAVPYKETSALLRSHDVFVLFSDYEGLPLSLLEAMGAGVVPVVSDLESGIRDVVNSQNGVRVPAGNVVAAADAIVALARNRHALAALSETAVRSVRETYSASRMAARYLELIDELGEPDSVSVPAPLGVRPAWLYLGLPRAVRRWTKRLIGAWRESSSQ